MSEKEKNKYNGQISYKKLWEKLEEKNIKKIDLINKYNLSPTLINRLRKNENTSLETIAYLCDCLNCEPWEIFEYIK